MNVEDRLRLLEAKVRLLEIELAEIRNASSRPAQEADPPPLGAQPASNQAIAEPQNFPADQGATNPPPYDSRQDFVPKPPKPPVDWEHLIARVWLPRVFIVVLLLGVVWGFTAAVTAGIITEPIRCLIGIVAAAAMYMIGEKQMRSGRSGLGQVLIGGGVAVLILAFVAAHMLYDLIPVMVAIPLYLGAIGFGVFASLRHRSQTLIMAVMAAGFLLPFMLDLSYPDPWLFVGYEALFSIIMLVVSSRYGFRTAYCTAFVLLHLPLFIAYHSFEARGELLLFLLAVLLQHVAIYILTVFSRPAPPPAYRQALLFTSFGLLTLWMYDLYGDHSPGLYSIMLGIITLLYGFTAYRTFKLQQSYAVYAGIATFGGMLWIMHAIHPDIRTGAVVLEGAAALWLGLHLRNKLQWLIGTVIYTISVLFVIGMPISELFSAETLSWLIVLISLPLLYKKILDSRKSGDDSILPVNLLMWAEGVLLLYFITQATNLLTVSLNDDAQHLILSIVWILYAVAVIVAGMIINKGKVRLAGVAFLFLTLFKIIVVDLPGVSTAVRAILFIGLGAAGIAVSRLLYRKKD